MNLIFHIHYRTTTDEKLAVRYRQKSSSEFRQLFLNSYDQIHWIAALEIPSGQAIEYHYILVSGHTVLEEASPIRKVKLQDGISQYHIQDQWRAFSDKKRLFHSAAFEKVLLKREKTNAHEKNTGITKTGIQFRMHAPDVPVDTYLAVVGNHEDLGEWERPIGLHEVNFPEWQVTIPIQTEELDIEYKFVLCNRDTGQIVNWEAGENRQLHFYFPKDNPCLLISSVEGYRYANPWWRAAGLAIPVFSLRSNKGMGIGEYADLKSLVDFSAKAGLKMIQVLPVNDTIASKTWVDSYPYAAISVFALHPLYINIAEIGPFENKQDEQRYRKAIKSLNAKTQIDFEKVLELKFEFLNILYQQHKKKILASKAFKTFFQTNKHWLKPYAAFCHFRDKYENPDFNTWPEHSEYDAEAIEKLCQPKSKDFEKIAFYFFVQFFADKQLKAAKSYGQKKGVVLKGDLPIGIYRYSADAWVAPALYNMNEQAGAPPDDYAELGQNWGFPTYNWAEMAKDDFAWWQNRMRQLAEYFDALRIDHILGFFRIWQIPLNQISGTLGLFNPRMPYSIEELGQMGLYGDLTRFSIPQVNAQYLETNFGALAPWVSKTFLQTKDAINYNFKTTFDSQLKISAYFEQKAAKKYQPAYPAVLKMASEVLLIEEPNSEGQYFNPRITLNKTAAYNLLNASERAAFDRIYADYFFNRHDNYWQKQAEWKLPALLKATEMLICGEDLGMIPASVPGVMNALNIIPLEIQRMPKGNTTYGIPHQYSYFSVCSPSCHDMSTIRGWWEGDEANAQRFYNEHLGRFGQVPKSCPVEIVQDINQEHLDAPSILAIFPIQDLLGMDDNLKLENAFAEQINEPSNPKHYWRYRLHIPIEQLIGESAFIEKIRGMITRSGR